MESLTIQRNYRRNNGICSIMVGLCCILIFTQQLSAQIEEWPEYTSDETDCANSWDKFLTNSYVPWGVPGRAWMTVPPEIEVKTSTIESAGLGAFATTFISASTWLAEYEGEVFTNDDIVTEYAWQIYRNDTIDYFVDAAKVDTSNWVRWVNCPRTIQEENVRGLYCLGKVFYITKKDVYPGQELFVYYGSDYASDLGIEIEQFDV